MTDEKINWLTVSDMIDIGKKIHSSKLDTVKKVLYQIEPMLEEKKLEYINDHEKYNELYAKVIEEIGKEKSLTEADEVNIGFIVGELIK